MDKNSVYSGSIIGGTEVGCVTSTRTDKTLIHTTNRLFWDEKGSDLLRETALPKYGAFVSEEEWKLFDDAAGKKVLDIGCGSGCSLQYVGEHKASELWGMDISQQQIDKAKKRLELCGLSSKLVCAPMEDECGIPKDYFDIVYSIYAIGWTTSLENTFDRVASYLKKEGVFIFSWSHPIHKCVTKENDAFVFKKSYYDESWYSLSLGDGTLKLSDRMLSTYVNALAKAGFLIEQMIEQSDDKILHSCDDNNEFAKKAKMLPVTFIIKARKL